MKAIVYDGIQKVQCREVEDPKIEKDDDIIVKVTSTAICGSDLHLVHGLVLQVQKIILNYYLLFYFLYSKIPM